MPHPKWRTLLAASVIFTIDGATLQAKPSTDNTPAYRSISRGEFQRMVSAGEQIKGRLVPSEYITDVLEDAENLLKRSPDARIVLNSSKVAEGTIQPMRPTRNIQAYPETIRKHMGGEKNKQIVYLGLPIDISDTDFDANLYLDKVVIEKPMTLVNIDFRQSVSLQGSVLEDDLDLEQVRLQRITNFSAVFLEKAALSFMDCEFQFQANFADLVIPESSRLFIGGDRISVPLDFSGSQISGKLTLQGMERTLQVEHVVYLNRVNADSRVPVGELYFKDIIFHDTIYMGDSKWALLELAESQDGRHRPMRFLGFCDFRQGRFGAVDLSGAEFNGGGDFSDSIFLTAISFERTKLRQPVRITWSQLRGKLRPVTPSGKIPDSKAEGMLSVTSYEELERNFENLGDLGSQNKCNYEKRRKYEGMNISWLISGYWVVWWVPLLWVLGSLFAFYCINRKKFHQQWFGLRKSSVPKHLAPEPWGLTIQTTFRLLLPKDYWGTVRGQRLYLLESVWLKIVLGVFVFTLKNTSPLLKELLPYLLPK